MNPTAKQVAIELRLLADALEVEPDMEIIKPWISFYGSEKYSFLNTAKLIPRPLTKSVSSPGAKWARLLVEHKSESMDVRVSVPQSLTCTLIEPAREAVYRCEPILSDIEDAGVSL